MTSRIQRVRVCSQQHHVADCDSQLEHVARALCVSKVQHCSNVPGTVNRVGPYYHVLIIEVTVDYA